MAKISEFSQHDMEVIAREYADLKEAVRKRCTEAYELDMVQKAFEFANEAHKGVRRRSGEPYILHPIAVAKIVVSSIGLGYKSIVAALLHDIVHIQSMTSRAFLERRLHLWSMALQRSRPCLTMRIKPSRKACRPRTSSASSSH